MCSINVSCYYIRSILFSSVYRKKPHSFINKQVLTAPLGANLCSIFRTQRNKETIYFHGSHVPEGDLEDKLNKTYCMPGGEIWLKKRSDAGGELFRTGKSLRDMPKGI